MVLKLCDTNQQKVRGCSYTLCNSAEGEPRDPERPIIDTADCEINGKRDWVRESDTRVRADQWNFWKVLACTRRIGLYGQEGEIADSKFRGIFGRITWRTCSDWSRTDGAVPYFFAISLICHRLLMSTGNLNEENLRLQSINRSYEIEIEFYM